MMRKDVKIGFAIGGILVAVLIVYVLAVSAGGGAKKQQGVQLAEGPTPTPATITDKPADKPTEATDPFKQSASDSTTASGASSASPPSIPPEKSEPKGTEEDKWMLALSRGTVPMMTTTPAPGDAKSTAPAAPAAPKASWPVSTASDEKATSTPTKSEAVPMTAAVDPPASTDATATTQPTQLASTSTLSSKSTKSVPAGARTHVVAANETITKIALAAYGNANFYPHILRANPDVNPNRMKPGTVLVLPPESDVKAGLSSPAASSGSSSDKAESNTVAPLTVAHTASAAAPLNPKTQYEVQPGDSLQKISSKLYGTMNKWQAIYDLNKATIGADPQKVRVKTVLRLPEPPTVK